GVDGLDAALAELSDTLISEPLADENGIVSVDLSTGVIQVDLEQAYVESHPEGEEVDSLNGLDPNTQLLDEATLSGITTAVSDAMGTLTTKATTGLEVVLNNTEVTLDLGADLNLLLRDSNIDITIDTSLGYLVGTSDEAPTIDADGNLLG